MKRIVSIAIAMAALAPISAQVPNLHKQRVTFPHANLTLVGFLFRPDGPGPFPAIIWNHGSEKNPGTSPEFDAFPMFSPDGAKLVWASNRHGKVQGETNVFIADWIEHP